MSTHRIAWRGALTVGTIEAPAQLLMVAESPSKVAFHHAHRCTRTKVTRLQQKRWCPTCRKELGKGDIVRVHEDTPGHYLEITDQEITQCEPKSNDALTITQVVTDRLNPLFIDTTALLLPDGDAASEAFATIRAALGAMTAFATVVLSKRTTHVAITSINQAMIVHILRPSDQVSELCARTAFTVSVDRGIVQHVRLRLQGLERPFNYEQIADEYTQNVREMVRTKLQDKTKSTLTAVVARARSRSAR